MSKGIAPIIGAVLLIMIALIVASIVFQWLGGFSREGAADIERRTENELRCQNAELYITDASYDCNNDCSSGVDHTITASVRNQGSINITIDEILMRNTTGHLFIFDVSERELEPDDTINIIGTSNDSCLGINNSIKEVDVISINCPEDARDRYPGGDVTYLNC